MVGSDDIVVCPKCSTPMELVSTRPFKSHEDIEDRTYKCPKCGHSEAWVVKEL
jgi:endogenous inhibitor of DNA gyrase (YacG/DUF329 family)